MFEELINSSSWLPKGFRGSALSPRSPFHQVEHDGGSSGSHEVSQVSDSRCLFCKLAANNVDGEMHVPGALTG